MQVRLNNWQTEVWNDPHRFKVICAGRRSGKSVLSQLTTIEKASKEKGLYWIVAPTYRQAKEIHWRGIQEYIPRKLIAAKNETELSIELINGSRISLKGAENPDSLRGVKLRYLIIDEIAAIRNWDYLWSEALRPTLTDYASPAMFISTPKGYNHFFELFQRGQNDEVYKSWQFDSYQNPYIPKDEIEQAREELTESQFGQEYLAQFKKYTGLVYPEFDRKFHVKEIKDFKAKFYLRGLDKGYRNPTAVPFIAVDKEDVWYQYTEIYKAGLTNPQISELIKQVSGNKEFELSTMDSAHASDIKDLNDMGDFGFLPVKKEPGEQNVSYIEWKIQKMAERIKADKYFVHPKCINTIYEFEKYSYPESKEDEPEKEAPIKLNDHAMDALADLNGFYIHYYKELEVKPWHGKVKGTYIPPANEEIEAETGFAEERIDPYWEDDI